MNARINEMIKKNIRGPQRLMALAKKMKNLQNFVHLSSCYVNADKLYEMRPIF